MRMPGFLCFQEPADASDRAACPDCGDEYVNHAAGIAPELDGGRTPVNFPD